MAIRIRKAAVLGAGVMGAQIAAHLANQGIPCHLLDIVPRELTEQEQAQGLSLDDAPVRNRLATAAIRRLGELKPSPVYTGSVVELLTPGNIEDHLDRLQEADWVIEAVVEELQAKRSLWAKAAQHLQAGALASTNTSGIPIGSIAQDLPEDFRRRFMGTHFFNPPRYLRLLEIIPTPDTDPSLVQGFREFAETRLGKGVVICKDTPNFIGNRIGVYGLMVALEAMTAMELGPDEVDSITGPAMGRPRSATFRTLDLVGLDTFAHVADNVREAVTEQWEQEAFVLPTYLQTMLERGWLGEKSGQGFYKRVRKDGEREILALDLESMDYRPRKRLNAPSLQQTKGIDDVRERLRTLVWADDVAGCYAWEVTKKVLLYSAAKLEEIADDIVGIDQAMRWGFTWDLGPFQAWDAIGLRASVERMEADGETVPVWVKKLVDAGNESFYTNEPTATHYATPAGEYQPVQEDPRVISITRLQAQEKVIKATPGATLLDMGDDVALVDFHSPKQAIGPDMINLLRFAAEEVPRNFRGLVVGSHVAPNFCVGANVFLMLMGAQEEEWDELDLMARQFQGTMMALKYLEGPVVVAPYGLTLGGGVELAFGGDRVVAAAETYIGLVEVGAGLIPGGGGCKEMLLRALEGVPGALDNLPPSPVTAALGNLDLQPLVNRVFETIATAKVATSAREGQQLGYLRQADTVVPNVDHLLHVAKEQVLALDRSGYNPPTVPKIPALGNEGRALLELAALQMHWSGYASEHDVKIAHKLAYVLSGGNLPAGTRVTEQYLLDLEREAFLSLCGEPLTQARMQHILQTGKPLRN